MFFPIVGHATRRGRYCKLRIAILLFGNLDPAFDLANRVQVFGHTVAIVGPKISLEAMYLIVDLVEDAALLLDASEPLFRCRTVAEHAVENNSRIDLHRHRRGRRSPRNRVHIRAAETHVAGTDKAAVILDREFERRQQRLLPDLLSSNLVDGYSSANVSAVRSLGVHTIQEHGRTSRMVAAIVARSLRTRHRMHEVADHDHLIF